MEKLLKGYEQMKIEIKLNKNQQPQQQKRSKIKKKSQASNLVQKDMGDQSSRLNPCTT